MGWLFQTLKETSALSKKQSPEVPCLALSGTNDELVEISTVRKRMANWPGGTFEQIQDAKHDLLSEVSEIRQNAVAKISQHFIEASDFRAGLENCA